MSTIPGCGNCDRPVQDGAQLCSTCTTALAQALRSVPDLLENLFVTFTKQDRLNAGGGHRGKLAEAPLPVRFDITRVIDALGNEMTTWARILVERHGWDVPNPPRRRPHNGLRGVVIPASSPNVDLYCFAAEWLADHVGYLRQHIAALEAHRGITGAIATAELAMDRPDVGLFIGPCDQCSADLYSAGPKETTARCGCCGVTCANVPERWNRALERLRGCAATAAFIAGYLGDWYGQQINQDTIRKWHQRKELTAVDWVELTEGGERKVPRFRIGAVLDRAKAARPRRAG